MSKCKPCLGSEVKQFLSQMKDARIDSILAQVPECPDSRDIVLCGSIRKRSGGKREPSAYNVFIGKCIREKPSSIPVTERMKACGRDWKQSKKS